MNWSAFKRWALGILAVLGVAAAVAQLAPDHTIADRAGREVGRAVELAVPLVRALPDDVPDAGRDAGR